MISASKDPKNPLTIAMIGVSKNLTKPSTIVMKYMKSYGYKVIPVNPRAKGEMILGEKVFGKLDEIKKIAEITHKHNLNLHMDGARFANALVSLDVTPAEMTWKSGVDVLSFGATKNGCLAAEAIIFFKKDLVGDIAFLMKRAGHLLSKMRFVSAQLDAYISNDVWLRNAKHANSMGKKLSDGLSKHNDIEITYPTEANEVFAKFPREKIEHLNSEGYKMNEDELDGKAVRLVAAWNTKDSDIDELLNIIKTN